MNAFYAHSARLLYKLAEPVKVTTRQVAAPQLHGKQTPVTPPAHALSVFGATKARRRTLSMDSTQVLPTQGQS